MSREFDIIIHGATGFTGVKVAEYLRDTNEAGLKWAISGRSAEKMQQLLTSLNVEVPAFIANSNDKESLLSSFSKAKLVLNCTGPYRFLGEAVVEACITSGTHYMDLCGEPQFIETMINKYHTQAVEKNVLILHACAFDSVPADLGYLYTYNKLPSAHSIESFLQLHTTSNTIAGHYTTYECAVHGFGDTHTLHTVRAENQKKYNYPKITHPGKKLKRIGTYEYDNSYIIPFMGSDAAVVKQTMRTVAQSTGNTTWPQYAAYSMISSGYYLALTAVYGGIFSTLAGFEFGRNLLLKYPETFSGGIFSHAGPTEEQLKSTSFSTLFIAKDDSKTVKTRVSGPEPGYVATPIIFIVLAKLLLTSRDVMPSGVLTPGAAFGNIPQVYDKLNEAGIKFEVLEE